MQCDLSTPVYSDVQYKKPDFGLRYQIPLDVMEVTKLPEFEHLMGSAQEP